MRDKAVHEEREALTLALHQALLTLGDRMVRAQAQTAAQLHMLAQQLEAEGQDPARRAVLIGAQRVLESRYEAEHAEAERQIAALKADVARHQLQAHTSRAQPQASAAPARVSSPARHPHSHLAASAADLVHTHLALHPGGGLTQAPAAPGYLTESLHSGGVPDIAAIDSLRASAADMEAYRDLDNQQLRLQQQAEGMGTGYAEGGQDEASAGCDKQYVEEGDGSQSELSMFSADLEAQRRELIVAVTAKARELERQKRMEKVGARSAQRVQEVFSR